MTLPATLRPPIGSVWRDEPTGWKDHTGRVVVIADNHDGTMMVDDADDQGHALGIDLRAWNVEWFDKGRIR